VERSILGDGCIVEPDAKITHSVVGLRSIIREGCVIEDSLLMGADYYEQYEECEAYADCLPLGVGKGTHIRGAIVDKNARIGKFCKIVNAEGIQVCVCVWCVCMCVCVCVWCVWGGGEGGL
jgi:glucose-1-phosphate adenylyltransferase